MKERSVTPDAFRHPPSRNLNGRHGVNFGGPRNKSGVAREVAAVLVLLKIARGSCLANLAKDG